MRKKDSVGIFLSTLISNLFCLAIEFIVAPVNVSQSNYGYNKGNLMQEFDFYGDKQFKLLMSVQC